jgi:hypothetical protein
MRKPWIAPQEAALNMRNERYGALKRRARLQWWKIPASTRDHLIDLGVELFPTDYHSGLVESTLRMRLEHRIRQEYGSLLAMFLIQLAVSAIVKLIISWWWVSDENRRAMEAWRTYALESAQFQGGQ